MKKPAPKKKPSDYPLFAFRIESELKDTFNKIIDEILEKKNKRLKEGERTVRKNDIIAEALGDGLSGMLNRKKS